MRYTIGGSGRCLGLRGSLSDEAQDWLQECHREPAVRQQVIQHFARIFDLLEKHGTWIGMPYVRKVRGELWEARVNHPTGAYRVFFGLVPGGAIAVACGSAKKSDRFPPSLYDWAEQKVAAYVARIIRERSGGG